MKLRPNPILAVITFSVFVAGPSVSESYGQTQPNTNAAYHQLRNLLPGGASITADNLVLKRDAATFTFTRGEFALFGEVKGKVTGAVFSGQGHFHLAPPTDIERHSLQILTKKPEFDEDFSLVVLRFTDSTAEELRAGAGKTPAGGSSGMAQSAIEFHQFQRDHLHENLDLRILEDVLSPAHGGFFLAGIKGSSDAHIVFEIDPHGAEGVAPEEVRTGIWNSWGWMYPSAFHLTSEYAANTASGRQQNQAFHVEYVDLDTRIEKNAYLSGLATIHLVALEDGVEVVPLDLFPTLRVSKVEDEHGESLDFVQEKKEDDPQFGLILVKPLKKGDAATVKVTYGGKDAVHNAGNDNYDPIARMNWFPNGGSSFGSYTRYKMVFHTPKEDELIATGTKLSDKVDGKMRTTEWDSLTPLPVAGFHLGRFREKDAKTPDGLAVTAYANEDLPDWAARIVNSGVGGVGTMTTTSMLPVELSEGAVAAQIYTAYFGKLPFDHLALSQQPACDFGQSWPMLVYLPICGFWDSTIQHELGLGAGDPYWKTVTAHEVAHQWWGHTVGFASYRDQWMSEGFAQASASIFLNATRKNPNDSRDFWRQLKEEITQKNSDGFRPIEVGPVTMGFRLSTQKTGWGVYENLVYPKGAYILHMIQMMMYTQHDGDQDFKAMMHDFVESYRLKVATTEDFKAMVEKHMTPVMDLDHNHRMDWFFNEYVYGTELPTYHFESKVDAGSDVVNLAFKLTQSGVSAGFKMVVPIYVELNDGRSLKLGGMAMDGDTTSEHSIQIPKPPAPVKRLSIDLNHDVLAIEN